MNPHDYTASVWELFSKVSGADIFLALMGQMLHILMRVQKVFRSKQQFVWRKWVVLNLIETIISFLAMVVCLLIFSKLGELTSITDFLIGYASDSMLKQLLNRGQKAIVSKADQGVN
jgi:hypothetical protein